jgi:hypothetical protein
MSGPRSANRTVVELEDGAVPEDRLALGPAQDEPRPARKLRASRSHLPAPGHPQVAPEDGPVVEPKQEVGYRWRTRHRVRPGRYYVQVSGIVLGLDCTPHKPCPIGWSNVPRVVVPPP